MTVAPKPDAPKETPAETPEVPVFTQAAAYKLIEHASQLMTLERKVAEQVRAYAKANGLTDAQAQEYITYLNGDASQPAWVNQLKDGKKPADSIELFEFEQYKGQLKTTRDAFVGEISQYNALEKKPEGGPQQLNAANAIKAMREQLAKPEHTAVDATLAMLNATSSEPAAANFLVGKATGGKSLVASAWLGNQDWSESISGWFGGIVDSVKGSAKSAFDEAKSLVSSDKPGAETAGQGEGTAAPDADSGKEGWMDYFKKNWGALAGAGGVGALFYLIGNSLAGNSFLGKIIGIMAGVLGAIMGFKFFGGQSNSDLPQGQAPRYPGVMQPQQENPMGQQLFDEATTQRPGHPSYLRYQNRSMEPFDTNRDGVISGNESQAYRAEALRVIEQNNIRYSHGTGSGQLPCIPGIRSTNCDRGR